MIVEVCDIIHLEESLENNYCNPLELLETEGE